MQEDLRTPFNPNPNPMSEIKQINTGVAELLAVKVPEYELAMVFENELFLNKLSQEAHFRLNLPPGKWIPLGFSTELTEEQCRELVTKGWNIAFGILYKGAVRYHVTAQKAFASLMQANKCYTENPLEYKLQSTQDNFENSKCDNTEVQIVQDLYDEAEANTGTWLVLKRLS